MNNELQRDDKGLLGQVGRLRGLHSLAFENHGLYIIHAFCKFQLRNIVALDSGIFRKNCREDSPLNNS